MSISHRDPENSINRQVFNGNNAGTKFKSSSSQIRVSYHQNPEWPQVHIFPRSAHEDPFSTMTVENFKMPLPRHTVLLYFWKYLAMQLNIDRAATYKLASTPRGIWRRTSCPMGLRQSFGDTIASEVSSSGTATDFMEMSARGWYLNESCPKRTGRRCWLRLGPRPNSRKRGGKHPNVARESHARTEVVLVPAGVGRAEPATQ